MRLRARKERGRKSLTAQVTPPCSKQVEDGVGPAALAQDLAWPALEVGAGEPPGLDCCCGCRIV